MEVDQQSSVSLPSLPTPGTSDRRDALEQEGFRDVHGNAYQIESADCREPVARHSDNPVG